MPLPEPVYTDEDPEFEHVRTNKPPKWKLPETPFQVNVLKLFGRKYFEKGEKGRLVMIEKAMLPLRTNLNHPPTYPEEWVQRIMGWVVAMRNKGRMIQLDGFLSALENTDKKQAFIERQVERLKHDKRFNPAIVSQKGVEVTHGKPNYDVAPSDPDPSD